MLADAGINPKAIQQRLGHHSAIFSLDVYTHNTENAQDGISDLTIFRCQIEFNYINKKQKSLQALLLEDFYWCSRVGSNHRPTV
jgi:hypothetical protein